jgi:hypothetical protein
VVIPVHYPAGDNAPDGPLRKFISSVGVDPEEPIARASLQRRGLSENLRVVLLESRG